MVYISQLLSSKVENILLVRDSLETLVQINHFDLSKFIDPISMMKTFCLTANNLAGEILSGQGKGVHLSNVLVECMADSLLTCLFGYPPLSEESGDISLARQINIILYASFVVGYSSIKAVS